MKPARIAVLVIALGAGVAAAMLAGRGPKTEAVPAAPVAQIETTDVLVAKSDIGVGQSVKADDLQWQTWPTAAAGVNFIRKPDRPDAIEKLSGSIARGSFAGGEPIRESKLVKAGASGYMAAVLPSGMRAVSTEISPETGAGGFILPGDHVDVILSRRDKEAEKTTGTDVHVSETVLKNITVLAIDQTVEEKNGQRVVVGKTATLELGPRQAETLSVSRQRGTLSLALRSITDIGASSADAGEAPRRNGVNMVRFGVTTTTNPK